MEKPLNRIALFIWIVAAFVAISQIIAEPFFHFRAYEVAPELRDPAAYYAVTMWYFAEIRSGLISAALLVGAGALVELVDQIRWNALYRDR
jgi:hypothetical protein